MCTTHVCTVASGQVTLIASGSPFKPSQHTINACRAGRLVFVDVGARGGGAWPSDHACSIQPVVHGLGCHPETVGDRGDGQLLAVVELAERRGVRPGGIERAKASDCRVSAQRVVDAVRCRCRTRRCRECEVVTLIAPCGEISIYRRALALGD